MARQVMDGESCGESHIGKNKISTLPNNSREWRAIPEKAKCIVFASHKGGTGKTTSCLSIAGFMAKRGCKSLVVDLDPQANATSGLGIDKMTLKHSIYDAILSQCDGYGDVPVSRVILDGGVENLHIAPSELDLSVAEVLMQQTGNKTGILNRVLKEVRHKYDYILVDLPPSSGLLTINGLCAADHVVVPLDPGIFSLEVLDNLKISFNDVRRMTGHTIDQVTAVLIRYANVGMVSKIFRKRTPSQEVEARLREMFRTVFVVPESVKIYEAQREGVPISHYAPQSRSGKAYRKICENIIGSDQVK